MATIWVRNPSTGQTGHIVARYWAANCYWPGGGKHADIQLKDGLLLTAMCLKFWRAIRKKEIK